MNVVSRENKSGITTDQIDLRDVPLSRMGALANAGLLNHALPDLSVDRVGVAAFQSSI
ncbi:hypothetical protein [Sphaerisporangium dianthi]|uniref:FXSXX-COOH protein n=1 Tax=Sphaerisporangium dianthi TaxID=1436120 RepID=A0ABV9CDU0_9ACTN